MSRTDRMTKAQKEDMRNAAIEKLRGMLPKGSVVYSNLTRVSASGMSRRIRCYIPVKADNGLEIMDITWMVSNALEWSMNDSGILVSGCGMDMGFHLISTLARVIHRDYKTLTNRWL